MDGEKVISRQRGFTVDSCVSAIAADSETPEFNGLSTGEKVRGHNLLSLKYRIATRLLEEESV